jgi:hypothetical protein
MEYKINTATAKREVRRQRASWDKLVTNLELGTYSTQSKEYNK